MVDSSPPTNRPADLVCPWCSAAITAETAVCPSCNAILNATEELNLPGVTSVDAKAVLQPAIKTPQARNRIMSWISGDYPDDGTSPSDSQALARPDPEVQREMLRLELEAEVANLQAENDALLSEAAMEGRVVEIPDSIKPLLTSEALAEVENAAAENSAEGDGAEPASDGEAPTAETETPAAETETPAAETDAAPATEGDAAPATEGDAGPEGTDPA